MIVRRWPAWLPMLALALLAGLSLILLEWSHRQWRAALQVQVAALDNLSQARRHVTLAYLIAGRAAAGDPTFQLSDAQAHLERASLALADWQRGESTLLQMAGAPPPSPSLAAAVRDYQAAIVAFQPLLLPAEQGGDPVAQRTAFAELERDAGRLEAELYTTLGGALAAQERGHLVTMASWGGALTLIGLTLYRGALARQQAAARLRQSEARMEGILESAMDAVITTDAAQRVVLFNASAERLFGYPRDAVLGQPLDLLLPERHRAVHGAHVRAFGATGVTSRTMGNLQQLAARRADGSEFPIEASISQIVVGGQPLFTVILRDITRRQEAEALLRRQAHLLDQSYDAIVVRELDGPIVYWNQGAVALYGIAADAALGQNSHRLLRTQHPEGAATVTSALRRDGRWEGELQHTTGGGGQITVESRQVLVPQESGPPYVLESNRDITRRVQVEARLRASEARLQAILDAAPALIYLKDREGRFLFVNRRLAALCEREPAAIIGLTDAELFPTASAAAFQANDREVLASGATREWEETLTLADGPHTYHSVKFPLVADGDGAPYALCGISTDITVQQQLRAQLLRAQRLETVGRLAGGVAHDFNNLLTVITGSAELALESLEPDTTAHADLEAIREAASRAARLTSQLLAFARKQVIAPVALDLNAVVVGLEPLLRRLLGEDITLVVTAAPGLEPVMADPGQIEQVLVNLAVNARDAMPEGGRLTIATAGSVFTPNTPAQPADRAVVLTVSDTGTGMDAATLEHVFEPFFTTKEPGRGTGLGLATCYGIVTQHGGQITLASAPGEGTEVTITLPATDGPVATPRLHRDDVLTRSDGETVLVVEDEAAVRGLAVRVLEQQGYTVLSAEDGAAAVELARAYQDTIDVLVTDMVLPQLRGDVVAERLRALYPRIAVVFISGYAEAGVPQLNGSFVSAQFVPKPFAPHILAQAVRGALDARNQGPPDRTTGTASADG